MYKSSIATYGRAIQFAGSCLCLVIITSMAFAQSTERAITKGKKISPDLFGLFFEDIITQLMADYMLNLFRTDHSNIVQQTEEIGIHFHTGSISRLVFLMALLMLKPVRRYIRIIRTILF